MIISFEFPNFCFTQLTRFVVCVYTFLIFFILMCCNFYCLRIITAKFFYNMVIEFLICFKLFSFMLYSQTWKVINIHRSHLLFQYKSTSFRVTTKDAEGSGGIFLPYISITYTQISIDDRSNPVDVSSLCKKLNSTWW